jgi:hypothetical protein
MYLVSFVSYTFQINNLVYSVQRNPKFNTQRYLIHLYYVEVSKSRLIVLDPESHHNQFKFIKLRKFNSFYIVSQLE